MNRLIVLLERQTRIVTDWKLAFRNGIVTGFGTALSATLLVWALLGALKPFETIEALGPLLEQLARQESNSHSQTNRR